MTDKKGLLEVLADKVGCGYLSDLRLPRKLSDLYESLTKTDAEEYTVSDWCDTVQYLSGERQSFGTQEEAKAFLMQALEEERKKKESE